MPTMSGPTMSAPTCGDAAVVSLVTIEGRCFTELGPGVNVDSTRIVQITFVSAGHANYAFPETEVTNG